MHLTETIPIKMAEVDKEIIPVVLWLNTYKSVYTLFSCEGTEHTEPYVISMCSPVELYDINKVISDFIITSRNIYDSIKVETGIFNDLFRFTISFRNRAICKEFCTFLLNEYIEIEHD